MCGIAGVLGTEAATAAVSAMVDHQRLRGPDDCGVEALDLNSGQATLGHARLAVLDLSPSGHQPMGTPDGRWMITFNGEIYNHRELRARAQGRGWEFRGSSDTEVLLACWALFGEGILDSLNGMFAFCIVDRIERSALLVRDRFGVKPLYYKHVRGGLAFASVPDALASVFGPVALDRGYLARGLSTWAYETQESDSAFSGILALPAGCLLRVDLREPDGPGRPDRWYDFRGGGTSDVGRHENDQEAAARVRALLTDSIDLRMRADVPVGLSLSGGLDSSIIAAVASHGVREPIHAFSFSLGPSDKETVAVDHLAATLGRKRLHVTRVGPPEPREMRETLERALICQGGPVGGLSALAQFQVFRAARSAGIVCMLGGQGADEAFMGYRKYQAAIVRESLTSRRPLRAATSASHLIRTLIAEGRDIRAYAQAAQRYRAHAHAHGLAALLPRVDALGIPAAPRTLQADDVLAAGLPTLLRMEDRNSMAHSIESRHPFLDYRVMELGYAYGADLNVRRGYGKWILRSAFGPALPESIAWARYKRGFDPGTGMWLERGVGRHLRSIIASRRAVISEALEVPREAIVPDSYTDAALEGSRTAMHEALTLSWVGLTLTQSKGITMADRRPVVVHVTTGHQADDVRIFERECRSLAESGAYDVHLAAAGRLPSGSGVSLIPLTPIPATRAARFTAGPRKAQTLARAVAADLWHFHDPELLPVALRLARRGTPVIWDAHEDYLSQFARDDDKGWIPGPLRGIVRSGMKRMLEAVDKRAAGVVAATPTIASRYSHPRTVVIGNEARLEHFVGCTPTFTADRVLFTGRTVAGHLFPEIVEAIAALPGVTLAVAGRAPDAGVWVAARERLGDRLTHLGWLDRDGLSAAMGDSSVGLVTYTDTDAYAVAAPTKLYEFCAAGLPVVVSPNASNVRYIDESGGGFVADGFSADALRRTIAVALSDERAWQEASTQGRQWASRVGSWEQSEKRLLELYQQVLGS